MDQTFDRGRTLSKGEYHEIWGTMCGSSLEEIERQQQKFQEFGVNAIEIRIDLIPPEVQPELRSELELKLPTYVAHFGSEGNEATKAKEELVEWLYCGASGIICHSRSPEANHLSTIAEENDKNFVAAFHSQTSPDRSRLRKELEYQKKFNPSFRKIAVRADSESDVINLIDVISEKTHKDHDVVGAVFGPQRWGRIALANVGSAITFITPHQIENEHGGSDHQFDVTEFNGLSSISQLFPSIREGRTRFD